MTQQLEFGNLPPRRPLLRVLRESPAARVMQAGVKNVSLLELIGSITGDADVALRLLTQYPTLSDLVRAPVTDLGLVHGLGPSKVAALQAAFELGRRAHFGTPADRRQIRSPSDAADLMLGEMSLLEQEEMRVMILDTRNRIIAVETRLRRRRPTVGGTPFRRDFNRQRLRCNCSGEDDVSTAQPPVKKSAVQCRYLKSTGGFSWNRRRVF